jgi:hypothetical protein
MDSFVLPFDFKNFKATQTEALVGDLSAVLAEHCQSRGKALVIEELDFEEKKDTQGRAQSSSLLSVRFCLCSIPPECPFKNTG